ncbi:hypothetical protein BGZ99_002073 [Dissophora globulifera]|uniref:SUN domain-containing protein n=1 Tax=Dissophora globulifera TaxID=979702 RepID=A0A9P6RNZ2_9FUNG|nr:hypothetical protein BGZ99_002073 [Dissophora globulifera]
MFCPAATDDNGRDHIIATPLEDPTRGHGLDLERNVETEEAPHGRDELDRHPSPVNQPALAPTIAGSTVVVFSRDSDTDTVGVDPQSTVTVSSERHESAFFDGASPQSTAAASTSSSSSSASSIVSQETRTAFNHQIKAAPSSASPTPTVSAPSQAERHIPSYEQWRKQVLEKKKPANPNDRKQRKRKPYQESAVDVAIGAEDELGFVFPNMDSNSGKSADDRVQPMADQLGNGPDLKQGPKDQEWIKSEYAKDPKDRFNHASATCAASVAKASKDATSIMAILNEGKDNYMLNRCSNKEKFFVVELCEEILVDTFVLGNYEFFSSTFKNFVVSVNRYPPRDDGWSILGHFQARNTRDAQVFRPAVPRLATYIRFDFLNHYGNEYYCPVTLLRVYGATALEQLKQEEEEEKRQAEEEKRLADLEKAREESAEAEDAEAEDVDEPEVVDNDEITLATDTTTTASEAAVHTIAASSDDPDNRPETSDVPILSHPSPLPDDSSTTPEASTVSLEQSERASQDKDAYGSQVELSDGLFSPEQPEAISPTFVFMDGPTTDTGDILTKDDPTVGHVLPLDTVLMSFEETTTSSSEQTITDIFPPSASTSPASMQDEGVWSSADLGMVTLAPKARPTQPPKLPSGSKPVSGGVGTAVGGGSTAAESTAPPSPSPQHSSQESVYKNIVNRLKVLELNSTLSYQYLEEQSNIFNEVLESSEQKINQLVSHLNEATRRLETLGRKYDQLAYSYRAHVEVDGEKRRQDFINLSTQVMFQRQLFVIGSITILLTIAFIVMTKSTTMHYALQQFPLGAKIRAISGHRRQALSNDITSSVRIGSVEGLTQFDQNSLLLQHSSERQNGMMHDDSKLAPPISPMEPLTPDPNRGSHSRLLSEGDHGPVNSTHQDSETSFREKNSAHRTSAEGSEGAHHTHSDQRSAMNEPESLDMTMLSKSQFESLVATRPSYPIHKNSHALGRLFLHANHGNSSQLLAYDNDYRPDSPIFQGPSGVHDEGQLSEADVAYISRDMDVGRKSLLSPGSTPTSPVVKRRLSTGYHSQIHHQGSHSGGSRPTSSLRMAVARSESDSPETQYSSSMNGIQSNGNSQDNSNINSNNNHSGDDGTIDAQPKVSGYKRGSEGKDNGELTVDSDIRTPDMLPLSEFEHQDVEEDEDVGFVSDSVLDSASESMTTSGRDRLQPLGSLGDWDRQHGIGEQISNHHEDDQEESHYHGPIEAATVAKDVGEEEERKSHIGAEAKLSTKERPRLTRDASSTSSSSSKSRRRSSHNLPRSQEYTSLTPHWDQGTIAGTTFELAEGLRLETSAEGLPFTPQDRGSVVPISQERRAGTGGSSKYSSDNDAGEQGDDDSAVVPQSLGERRKKNRKGSLPNDQPPQRRRGSYGCIVSDGVEADAILDDQGLEGDDEQSPQMSRKAS